MKPLPRTNPFVLMLGDHELDWIREAAANERVEPVDFIRRAALADVFEQRRIKSQEEAQMSPLTIVVDRREHAEIVLAAKLAEQKIWAYVRETLLVAARERIESAEADLGSQRENIREELRVLYEMRGLE